MKYPWFRVYSEIIFDPKIMRVSRNLDMPISEIVGYWVTLLCLANESPKRGDIMMGEGIALDLEDLEYYFGTPASIVEQILASFIELGMMNLDGDCYKINNWDKRQFKSDYSTKRVQKHRMEQDGNVTETLQKRYKGVSPVPPDVGGEDYSTPAYTETLQKRYSNVIESESDTESESKTEQEQEPSADSSFRLRINPVKILCDASGLSDFPADQREWVEVIQSMVDDHGMEKTTDAMKRACEAWIVTKTKDGRGYRRTNLNWINWAQEELAGGKIPGKERQLTAGEQITQLAAKLGGRSDL